MDRQEQFTSDDAEDRIAKLVKERFPTIGCVSVALIDPKEVITFGFWPGGPDERTRKALAVIVYKAMIEEPENRQRYQLTAFRIRRLVYFLAKVRTEPIEETSARFAERLGLPPEIVAEAFADPECKWPRI